MKQLITSIVVAGILLKVLFQTNDLLTKIVVSLFLIFAVGLGLTNVLTMVNKDELAAKVSKVYVIAFLIYWFGFLMIWNYISFKNREYMQIVVSVPMWLTGFYFAHKRLIKK